MVFGPGVEPFEVVFGRSAGLVEREVDDELRGVAVGRQQCVGDAVAVADVAEDDVDVAAGATPLVCERACVVRSRSARRVARAIRSRIFDRRAASLSKLSAARLMMSSVSTFARRSCTVGLTGSSLTMSSPTLLWSRLSLLATSWVSLPGIGLVMLPQLSAASRDASRPLKRFDFGDERGEQHGLDEAAVVGEGLASGSVGGGVVGDVVHGAQRRFELGAPQLLGGLEHRFEFARERLVAAGNDVPEVADGDDLADGEVIALVDEELQHHLECGAFALERFRHVDQAWTSAGRERVDGAEQFDVGVGAEQLSSARRRGRRAPDRRRARRAGRGRVVDWLQETLAGDDGQVARREFDAAEAALLEFEVVGEAASSLPAM